MELAMTELVSAKIVVTTAVRETMLSNFDMPRWLGIIGGEGSDKGTYLGSRSTRMTRSRQRSFTTV